MKHAKKRALWMIPGALVLIALFLLLLTGGEENAPIEADPSPAFETATPAPTAATTATPTPGPWTELLPVISKVDTQEKKIAITIDDLNEVGNLNEIMDLAISYNAKLTLFPIGENVTKKADLRAALRRAYELGFEIENHTYSHVDLYSLTDREMAGQIIYQNRAVNEALGLDYEMHFLRMKGGNGEYDLRSHMYLIQNGYKGVVDWYWSGTSVSAASSAQALTNGAVYLFHCKDKDLEKLRMLIPYFAEQGYQMVTLNELVGIEMNAVKPLDEKAMDAPVPEPGEFIYNEENYVLIGKKHYTQMYAVQLIQRRLMELGYLDASAAVDGDYGSVTRAAVVLFQEQNGLTADGLAGAETQKKLFSEEALPNPTAAVTPLPQK